MLSIKSAFGEIARGTVHIRARSLPLRGLTAHESGLIKAALPQPVAPLHADPARGSKAPWVQNHADPKFAAAYSVWSRRFNAARMAVAADMTTESGLGWKDVCGDPAKIGPWIAAAVDELCLTLSEAEIADAAEKINELSDPAGPELMAKAEAMLMLSGDDLAAAEAGDPGWERPKRYALTVMGLLLRALATHQVSIDEAEKLEPGVISALLASERLRMAEEAAKKE